MTNQELINHFNRKINLFNEMIVHGQINEQYALGAINVLRELIYDVEEGIIVNPDLITKIKHIE